MGVGMTILVEENTTRVKGIVHLELLDSNGDLLQEINDHNTATLWAKNNTPPVSLQMDLVTKDLSKYYNTSYSKFAHTISSDTVHTRSQLLNSPFTHSTSLKKFEISFSWSNGTGEDLSLYGLLSFCEDKTFTFFDLSNSSIIVAPLNVVNGKYTITYDQDTPDDPNSATITSQTISNSNQIIGNLAQQLTSDVRRYKYTRVFAKTYDP